MVFTDVNGDGIFNDGDTPLSGVMVSLYDAQGNLITSTFTNNQGFYTFPNLSDGTYTVSVIYNGTATTPTSYTINLGVNENYTLADFGFGSDPILSGVIWFDANLNGIFDPGEEPKQGLIVYIGDAAGNVLFQYEDQFGVSDIEGNFSITGLPAGDYTFFITNDNIDFYTTPTSYPVTITGPDQVINDLLFGCIPGLTNNGGPGIIVGVVFDDLNGNDMLDPGEPVIPGGTVTLCIQGVEGVIETFVVFEVNENGTYFFNGLNPGTYIIKYEGEVVGDPIVIPTFPDGETIVEFDIPVDLTNPSACDPIAGQIFITDGNGQSEYCEGSTIMVEAFGFVQDAQYNHVLLLVDASGTVVDVAYESATFADVPVGDLTVYGYTYEIGSVNLPVADIAFSDLNGVGCSELSPPVNVSVTPGIDITVDFNPDCVEISENSFQYELTISASGGEGLSYTVTGTADLTLEANVGQIILVDENSVVTFTVEDGSGCSSTFDTYLPNCSKTAVEMLEFYGRVEEPGNNLFWATATEIDAKLFEVQRSFDGVNFETIGSVDAIGNSTTRSDYNFMDVTAPNGISYYRLVTIDIYEFSSVSNIVQLEREHTGFEILNVSPVPTKDFLNVEFNVELNEDIQVNIYDATGRLVKVAQSNLTVNYNVLNLDVSGFASGAYFITVNTADDVKTAKFIKD